MSVNERELHCMKLLNDALLIKRKTRIRTEVHEMKFSPILTNLMGIKNDVTNFEVDYNIRLYLRALLSGQS